MFDSIQKELENVNLTGLTAVGSSDSSHLIKDARQGHDDSSSLADPDEYDNQSGIGKSVSEKGSKKKKGKAAGNAKAGSAESGPEFPESTKKKQKKGKVIPAAQISDSKSGAKKDTERMDNPSFLSEESLIRKILSLIPDLEEQGNFFPVSSYFKSLFRFCWI